MKEFLIEHQIYSSVALAILLILAVLACINFLPKESKWLDPITWYVIIAFVIGTHTLSENLIKWIIK